MHPLTNPRRKVLLADLEHLLTFPQLGAWGMDALKDTLSQLIPEMGQSTNES